MSLQSTFNSMLSSGATFSLVEQGITELEKKKRLEQAQQEEQQEQNQKEYKSMVPKKFEFNQKQDFNSLKGSMFDPLERYEKSVENEENQRQALEERWKQLGGVL